MFVGIYVYLYRCKYKEVYMLAKLTMIREHEADLEEEEIHLAK